MIALGGGAVLSSDTRELLARRAFTVLLEIDPETAWQRARQSRRPLAIDEESFHALFRDRLPLYEEVANAHAHAHDADGVILAAAAIDVRIGAIDLLEELVPGKGAVEIVSDANVAGIHGVTAQLALGDRDIALHEVPPASRPRRSQCWSGSGAPSGSGGTAPSSGSAAAAPPTSRGSQPRRTCGVCRGWPCRRPSSARSMRRSGARPRSISPAART